MAKTKDRGAGTRQYWREADARRALARLERSGLSLREFCRKADIPERRLRRWQEKLADSSAADEPTFREVRVVPSPAAGVPAPEFAGEVIIGAFRVRAPLGFDAAELRRLLETVAAC